MAYSKNRRLAEIVSDTSGNLSVEGIIVPTQSNSDNDTSAASTAFVHAHVNALVDSAPGTLNTLNELAAALNDEANFASTITTSVNAKLPLAGGTMTGNLRGTSFSVGAADSGEALNILDGGHTGQGATNTVSLASFAENVSGNSAGLWVGSMTNENTAVIGTRTASGNLGFQTYSGGWGERMRITSAGNVGIGTTSPDTPFHIASATPVMTLEETDASQEFEIGSYGGAFALRDKTNNAFRFVLNTSGNIGIGTTNPQRKLVLYQGDSGQTQIQFQNVTTGSAAGDGFGVGLDSAEKGFIWNYEGNDTYIGGAGGTSITIKNDGNVGIGATPTSTSGRLLITNSGTNQVVLKGASGSTNLNMGNFVGGGYISNNYYYSGGHQADDNSKGAFEVFIGDSNYGINYHAAGAAGTRRRDFAITDTGKVGIGTNSPLTNLHIGSGTAGENLGVKLNRGSTTNFFVACDNTKQAYIGVDNSNSYIKMGSLSNHDVAISQNNAHAIYIDTNKLARFYGNVELADGKPIFSETDNGTHQYSHLCTGSFYTGNNQGVAINTNIPSHNVSGNNMFMITIKGFAYDSAGGGIIDCNIGMYSGENGFHNASYSGSNIPREWLGKIRVGYTSANKLIILLGDIDTTTNYEIAVSCGVQGFYGVDPAYFSDWTTSAFTSLSGYTGVVNIPPKETTMIGFEAYSTSMSKSAGWHTISNSMSTEAYDHGGFYDTSTGKFQPTVAGMYMFSCGGYSSYNSGASGQERYAFSLSKNGSLNRISGGNYSDADTPLEGMTYVEYLNGGSDYVVLSMYSAVAVTLGHGSHPIWWQGHLINAGPGGSATSWTI